MKCPSRSEKARAKAEQGRGSTGQGSGQAAEASAVGNSRRGVQLLLAGSIVHRHAPWAGGKMGRQRVATAVWRLWGCSCPSVAIRLVVMVLENVLQRLQGRRRAGSRATIGCETGVRGRCILASGSVQPRKAYYTIHAYPTACKHLARHITQTTHTAQRPPC